MLLTVLSVVSTAYATLLCTSTESQPNPIAGQYGNLTTGTINGTIAILPIPYSQARSIIPSQYGILKASYQKWLPSLGEDMYPAMLQTQLDHDVGQGSTVKIPDFRRSSISYPFVDRLDDGYTPMTYGPVVAESVQVVSIAGTDAYGILAVPASFDPPCDAYAADGTAIYSNAATLNASITTRFGAVDSSPYTLDFWKNVTNQPQFGNNQLVCDNYIRLFNASVTHPVTVQGNVSADPPFFQSHMTWQNAYGLRLDNAFIENNFMTCQSLQGYHGTGSGD